MTTTERARQAGVLWLTGLPASGKTTLARALVAALQAAGRRATLIDSDEVRASLTPNPTYSTEERALVYRAIALMAATLSREGVVAVVAATAHDRSLRDAARALAGGRFFLVHASAPLEVCEARDPKGLYRAARTRGGTMPGVHVAYEPPDDADVTVDTSVPVDAPTLANVVRAFESRPW